MSAQGRSEVRDLLARHGITPARSHGQHFLVDPNITRKIVRLAELVPGDGVVEIGAGTGTLTRELAATGAEVVSFEIDRSLQPALAEALDGIPVDLRMEDASDIRFQDVLDAGRPWTMVANLPYNVGTSIVLDALRHSPIIGRFIVMVQREVADRLVAGPGDGAYGLPSVVAALHGVSRLEFTVPPQVFLPPPQVGSAVVSIRRTAPRPDSERAVALAAAGFGHRRKMLRSSLAGVLADPVVALEAAGIAPTRRAEELHVDDWVRLAGVGTP